VRVGNGRTGRQREIERERGKDKENEKGSAETGQDRTGLTGLGRRKKRQKSKQRLIQMIFHLSRVLKAGRMGQVHKVRGEI
jgi:hypothetical protein